MYLACEYTYQRHCRSLSRLITVYSVQSVGYMASKCNGQRCFYLPLPNASYLLMVLQRCMVDTQDNFFQGDSTNTNAIIYKYC